MGSWSASTETCNSFSTFLWKPFREKYPLYHQLFTNNPNRANPVKPRKNQPAMNWCAPVKSKIPAASDATNMKSRVKLSTHQTIRHCLSHSCVCVSVSFHSARCW